MSIIINMVIGSFALLIYRKHLKVTSKLLIEVESYIINFYAYTQNNKIKLEYKNKQEALEAIQNILMQRNGLQLDILFQVRIRNNGDKKINIKQIKLKAKTGELIEAQDNKVIFIRANSDYKTNIVFTVRNKEQMGSVLSNKCCLNILGNNGEFIKKVGYLEIKK